VLKEERRGGEMVKRGSGSIKRLGEKVFREGMRV
jgi:hypothetical protein